jgi:hypothetical protein
VKSSSFTFVVIVAECTIAFARGRDIQAVKGKCGSDVPMGRALPNIRLQNNPDWTSAVFS